MRIFTLFLTLLFIPVFAFAIELTSLPENITVTVTPLHKKYTTSEDLMVKVEFTNNSDEEIQFLVWGTPFEGRINGDFFSIRDENGNTIPYAGRIYKRGMPTAANFKTLSSGETISVLVNLYEAYQLQMAGNYSIQYLDNSLISKATDASQKQTTISYFTLEDDGTARSFKRTPDYNSCSSSQRATLDSALSKAEQLSRTARDDLRNTPTSLRASAERYNSWFGTYNSSRYSTVTTNFEKIYSAANSQTLGFDCSCTEPYYAYVYANSPYNIYFCSAYWGAPLTGTDSKAGTIIHELSHFTVVAGTDDHVYGQSGALNLARNNPNLAIENADSHEYFAENTPYLTMPTTVSISEAVDNSSLSWSKGGDEGFFGQKEVYSYDGDAAQSGSIDANEYSSLKTSFSSSVQLTFSWKVSSEYLNDFLEFRVDGVVMDKISGDSAWQQMTYTLRGEKSVEWRYVKDSSVVSGSDAGWVDRVIVEELDDSLIAPIIPILLDEN